MELTPSKKALLASAVGYAMDGFDFLILGFLLKAISADLHLSSVQAASLATFTLLGAVVGGALFGRLSDRFGRMRILQFTIVFFAVFTGLCALAQGYYDLLFYRTMAGLGLGGEFGVGMALASEVAQPGERARASSFVGLGWQVGVLCAALSTPLLLPYIGWRGMFAVGLFPALVSFALRRMLYVEPNYTSARGSIKLLWKEPKVTLSILVLCMVQNFGYYSLMIWLPSYLSAKMQSPIWTVSTILGMCLGIWSFGRLADHFGRRPSFLSFQFGAACMVILYSQLSSPFALILGGAFMGFFVNGMLGGYGALISECYPTSVRATAQNVLFDTGRAFGGFGPLVIASLLHVYSFPVLIASLSALYAVDMVVTYFFIPERRGQELPG